MNNEIIKLNQRINNYEKDRTKINHDAAANHRRTVNKEFKKDEKEYPPIIPPTITKDVKKQ